jgi:hypothetical protein
MRCSLWLFLVLPILAAPALAQDHPTFDSLRQDMEVKGCVPKDYPDYTLFRCQRERADYYFAGPSQPAGPAVVKRFLSHDNATETWWAFGGDETALKTLLDQFHRLDRTAPHRWPFQAELPPPRR